MLWLLACEPSPPSGGSPPSAGTLVELAEEAGDRVQEGAFRRLFEEDCCRPTLAFELALDRAIKFFPPLPDPIDTGGNP